MNQNFIKKTALITTLLSSMFISCNKEQACMRVAVWDLLFKVAAFIEPKVELGKPLAMETVLKYDYDECNRQKEKEKSKETIRSVKAEYSPGNGSPFVMQKLKSASGQQVDSLTITDNAFLSSTTIARRDSFAFNVPGIYRFTLTNDCRNDMAEVNENNTAEANNVASGRDGRLGGRSSNPGNGSNQYQLVVVVHDPTGQTKPNFEYATKPCVVSYLGGQVIN